MSRPRWVFVLYAAVLATATHWPQLRIEGPLPRTDLWIHVVAFALWTFLLGLTGWVRPAGTPRGTVLLWLIGVAYAMVDELSQGIPVLGRTVAWEDALANVGGATLGAAGYALPRLVVARGTPGGEIHRGDAEKGEGNAE